MPDIKTPSCYKHMNLYFFKRKTGVEFRIEGGFNRLRSLWVIRGLAYSFEIIKLPNESIFPIDSMFLLDLYGFWSCPCDYLTYRFFYQLYHYLKYILKCS